MQVCAARHQLATEGIKVPSESSSKTYKCTAYRPNEYPFCPCPDYIFRRAKAAREDGVDQRTIPFECKHLVKLLRETCSWQQEGPGDYRYDDTCPECGGPVVEDETDDAPSDLEDLKRLLEELS
jgi:hypothetical protein